MWTNLFCGIDEAAVTPYILFWPRVDENVAAESPTDDEMASTDQSKSQKSRKSIRGLIATALLLLAAAPLTERVVSEAHARGSAKTGDSPRFETVETSSDPIYLANLGGFLASTFRVQHVNRMSPRYSVELFAAQMAALEHAFSTFLRPNDPYSHCIASSFLRVFTFNCNGAIFSVS